MNKEEIEKIIKEYLKENLVKAIKYLLIGDWVKCREAIFILKMSFYE